MRCLLLSICLLFVVGCVGSGRASECGASAAVSSVPAERQAAEVLRVVDGDTIDVRVALGYDVFIKLRIRLYGVDTPEVYGVKKDSEEYQAGKRASQFTSAWAERNAGHIEVCGNHGTGKYGRWLLELCAGEENLSKLLIESGNAEEYYGGAR